MLICTVLPGTARQPVKTAWQALGAAVLFKNSRRMPDRGLATDSKSRQPLWKCWAAAVAVSLLLSGCIVIPLEFPQFPPQGERPAGDRKPAQPPDTTAQSDAIGQMEEKIRLRINEIRQKRGLNSLQSNDKLAKFARAYSKQMADNNFFSHTGIKGEGPAERVAKAGIFYWMVGENLFTSTNAPEPVPLAVEGWMNSPGHRENILRPGFTETGVGIWRKGNTYYVTQLFMRSL